MLDNNPLLATGRPLVIAHRGASAEWPENTLAAFDRAIELGADGIELDVRLSRDGIPVVIHDSLLDRTTNLEGPVSAYDADRLGRADAGRGEGVPTLAQVLARSGEVPIVIELKEIPAARPVKDLLSATAARHRVVVGSFEGAAVRPFKGYCGYSPGRREIGLRWVLSRARLAFARPGLCFCVPRVQGRLLVVDRPFLAASARISAAVHVWTIDDSEIALDLWESGVTGIITNDPADLIDARSQKD